MQLIDRSDGEFGSVVRVQAVAPPVGLLEVTTRPLAPTSTQSVVETQLTPKSDFAFGIFVPTQEAAPAPGSVVV